MKIVMFIFVLLFAIAAFIFNALINKWQAMSHKIQYLEAELRESKIDIDGVYDRFLELSTKLDETNHNVDLDKKNIDACANAILNIRNNIGKLGNRIQKIERKED